jgi:hypothetical protein
MYVCMCVYVYIVIRKKPFHFAYLIRVVLWA